MISLPVDVLRDDVVANLGRRPVVLTSPTGSGKSTQVPRWCRASGSVLVVQPRRVAARSLAVRVAHLEGEPLGQGVGYAVRGDSRQSDGTEVLFVTTGVALRMLADGVLNRFGTVILDELHERSLDLDLLLALLADAGRPLVVMSATLAGDRVAEHLGGVHLRAEGRLYPVEIRHRGEGMPGLRGLEARVARAVDELADLDGDLLVFLPGKGEIRRVRDALRTDREVLELHGGLTLQDQVRVFQQGRPRVVLATNVAETSLTVPGIAAVVDAGLVRRTRYHHGRGYLTLFPVAADSADQRAGRAGRLGPGVCVRLWGEHVRLQPTTPPEVHSESLVPLVLAAAAAGRPDLRLPFLDPLKDFAVADARADLTALGALGSDGGITERGRAMFRLPLDAHLGSLLVEARARGTLSDAVDLVAALAGGRRLFREPRPTEPEDDLRAGGCDATALVAAVRVGEPGRHRLDAHALREARQLRGRLRDAFGLHDVRGPLHRDSLAMTLLAAWPRSAHVARRRGRRVAWSPGGTEAGLARDSAVEEEEAEALVALDSRALAKSLRDKDVVITAAMPVPLRWLLRAGLGEDRLVGATLTGGQVLSRVERVYAGRVLEQREEPTTGRLARETVATLVERGRLFRGVWDEARDRLEAAALWRSLCAARGEDPGHTPHGDLPGWLVERLEELGLEGGEDLELLEPEDLLPDQLPDDVRRTLDHRYPRTLAIGDATYRIEYKPRQRVATLVQVSGARKALPPARLVPALPGWTVRVRDRSRVRVLRER